MQLQSGQIDVAPTFPFSLAQGVESNEALALDIFPSTQIYYLTVNTTKPPFDDVKVRQALYYALNKSELAIPSPGEHGTSVRHCLRDPGRLVQHRSAGDRVRSRHRQADAGRCRLPSSGVYPVHPHRLHLL